MKKMMISNLIIVLLGVVGFTVFAQETQEAPAAVCDAVAAQEDLALLSSGLADAEDLDAALRELRDRASAYVVACGELSFSDVTEGATNVVIGPVTFPDGFYRVTLVSEGLGTVNIETMDGDCGIFGLLSVMSLEGGEAQDGFEFTGCRALIEAKFTDPWTLDFELIQ